MKARKENASTYLALVLQRKQGQLDLPVCVTVQKLHKILTTAHCSTELAPSFEVLNKSPLLTHNSFQQQKPKVSLVQGTVEMDVASHNCARN